MAWHLYAALGEDGSWRRWDASLSPAGRAPAGEVEYSGDGCWAHEYRAGELQTIYTWLDGSVPKAGWKQAAAARDEFGPGSRQIGKR